MSPRYPLIALSTSLALLVSCGRQSEKPEVSVSRTPPISVKTVTLAETEVPEIYTAPGTVRAKTSSTLSSKVLAYVRSVNVHEGQRVRAGQTLVVLNGQDLDASYRGAEAAREEVSRSIEEADSAITEAKTNLDLTEVTYSRLKDLFDKRSISNQEFDEANAKLKSARAAYDRASARREQAQSRARQMDAELRAADITRGYETISAPFAGVVVSKNVDPGILASPGMALLTLEEEGSYRLEASVEESRLPSIRLHDCVPIQIDASKQNLSGVVSEISPSVDAASRTYTVKLDLPAVTGLHSGVFGRALFPSGNRRTLAVPSDVVVQEGDLVSVLVADGGFARRRLITTGAALTNKTIVLSGLYPGDALIYPIPQGLQDGMPIEVRP